MHLHTYYNFAGSLVETVPKSLRHSCGSELTRQGISLGCSRSVSGGAGLYLSRPRFMLAAMAWIFATPSGVRCSPRSIVTKQNLRQISIIPFHLLRKTLEESLRSSYLKGNFSELCIYMLKQCTVFQVLKKNWSSLWIISIGQLEHITVLPPPTYQPCSLHGV